MTEPPPEMFRRPSDPPDPLPPLRASDEVVRLHTEWARVHAASDDAHSLAGLRSRARVVASMAGGADHRLLGDLIRAVDAIAARVDELSERLDNMAITTDDLARSLSEEVSALRGTVERMSTDGREDSPRPNR